MCSKFRRPSAFLTIQNGMMLLTTAGLITGCVDLGLETGTSSSSATESTLSSEEESQVLESESSAEEVESGYSNLVESTLEVSNGTKVTVNLDLDGYTRDFIVYVPANLSAPAPVVYMFHGTSGSGEKFYNISGWVKKADEEGIIAVFPSALRYCFKEDDNLSGAFELPSELVVTTKWNEETLIGDNRQMCSQEEMDLYLSEELKAKISGLSLVDDVRFVDQTLEYLKSNYSIDESRIYATGFSNGANFTSLLSMKMADKFAAFASHGAGKIHTDSATALPATLFMSMGELDPKFLDLTGILPIDDVYDLAAFPVDESIMATFPINTMVWANLRAHSLDVNVYTTSADEQIEGSAMFTYNYDSSLVGANNSLSFTIMEGVGHIYPNGDARSPINMADFLWEKFEGITL